MKVKAAGKSDIGLKRKLNEDSYLIEPALDLYVIADGMGGHKAGEVASRMAIETMADYWRKVADKNPPSFLKEIDEDIPEKAKHLINSINLSNMIIHEAQKKPQYHKMGSTISALLVCENCMWLANVGDSPVFLFDNGRMVLVSEEHSIEAEHRSMGIDPSETFGSTNPMLKNILTRVLGLNEKVEVFLTPLRPDAGDLILLCSDGLTNYVTDEAIKTVMNDKSISLDRKVDILIEEANHGGGGDNVSVIILETAPEGKWTKLKRKFISKC